MAEEEARLAVQKDTSSEYSLVTKGPSPFPQHKGQPMWFGAVKLGKVYVSFLLMPLYMSPTLEKEISPSLKKRMHGKTCFNFKAITDEELLADLKKLTAACAAAWDKQFHLSVTSGSPCNQLNSGRWLTHYRGCWVFGIALLEINGRL